MAREDEILTHLLEECAEVIQCCTKIQRFGLTNYNPYEPHKGNNCERLSEELGQTLALMDKAIELGLVDPAIVEIAKQRKYNELA